MSDTRIDGERELRDQVERMAHRTAAISTMVDEYTAPLGAPAWILLRHVQRHAPARASDLAAASRFSKPSVSRFVTALEQAGLVELAPDPSDGRASLISLSEHGAEFLDRLAETGRQRMRELTEGFTVDEVELLSDLLRRLNDNADRHTDPPTGYQLERATP